MWCRVEVGLIAVGRGHCERAQHTGRNSSVVSGDFSRWAASCSGKAADRQGCADRRAGDGGFRLSGEAAWGIRKNEDATLPARDVKWREKKAPSPEAYEYIAMCRSFGAFALEELRDVGTSGTRLVKKVGWLVPESRQIQLIRPQEIDYAMNFIDRTHHLFPTIASEVMSIYTDGSMPKYTSFPPKPAPDDGYPHKAAHTIKILESTRWDLEQLKSIIRGETALIYGERLEYSLATTVPKRAPRRTLIDKSRAISGRRRINLGIDTDDFCPIWPPEAKRNTGRITRKNGKPPVPHIKICNMKITNSFKRAPPHPHSVSIYCRKFDSVASGRLQDAAMWRLPLPFGYAESPAIFATCTEAIQRVRHRMQAFDGSWPGWEPRNSEIFADLAVFVEEEGGDISTEAARRWGDSRRRLLGLDSIRDDKTKMEGPRSTRGLFLGFDLDTELGLYLPHYRKLKGRDYIFPATISLLAANALR